MRISKLLNFKKEEENILMSSSNTRVEQLTYPPLALHCWGVDTRVGQVTVVVKGDLTLQGRIDLVILIFIQSRRLNTF